MKNLRRYILAAGLMLLALVSHPLNAGPNGCTKDDFLVPMGDEQITVSTTAIGFTSTKIAPAGQRPADYASFAVETNSIRYRDSGLAPTSTVGFPMAAATSWAVCGPQAISRTLFIRQSADATVSASYYRRGDQ